MLSTTMNQAIIAEILAHLKRGEIQYCYQLGFSESELAELSNMSAQEVLDISSSSISFASIKINHGTFWNLIETARNNSRQRNLIDRALALGASSEILHARFGWSSAEVSARRKLLGISEAMGRKKNATEEESERIWQLWEEHKDSLNGEDVETSESGFDLLIFIAEETEVGLTEVSRLILGWNRMNKK